MTPKPTEVVGLVNLGNTCFINSTLQCLARCQGFENFLRRHVSSCPSPLESCVTCSVGKVVVRLRKEGGETFTPRGVIDKLGRISSSFRVGLQEDVHEFLAQLLDCMERECKKGNLEVCDTFNGEIISRVVCERCNTNSDTVEPLVILSLDVASVSNIDQALQKFRSKEQLAGDNSYRCETCKQRTRATKESFIRKLPKVLVIHLKRFDFCSLDLKKIQSQVSFPFLLRIPSSVRISCLAQVCSYSSLSLAPLVLLIPPSSPSSTLCV